MAIGKEDWNTVNVEVDLTEGNRALYLVAKECYRTYKAARDAFEQAMQADFSQHLPEGSELKFGYNFGKLSIAVGPKTERKAKAKPVVGLAAWLEAQGQAGRGQ